MASVVVSGIQPCVLWLDIAKTGVTPGMGLMVLDCDSLAWKEGIRRVIGATGMLRVAEIKSLK